MTEAEFQMVLGHRLEQVKQVLEKKAGGYAFNDDWLHNFKRAAGFAGVSPAQAALSMALKHFVSVSDMAAGHLAVTEENLNEKITDAINYLILIEACLRENVK